MKKIVVAILALLITMVFAACTAAGQPSALPTPLPSPTDAQATTAATPSPAPTQAAEASPAGVPARPGSGATGDPSANLQDLVEASGVVKEVKEGLVLITTPAGAEFMLRFSDNSKWDEGVDKTISTGNTITCLVKPEPTFTLPAQGEVYRVTGNKRP